MTRCDYCGQPEHRPYMQAAPMEYRPPGLFHAIVSIGVILGLSLGIGAFLLTIFALLWVLAGVR
jgi:hypothetical protein